jgi:hypothetical protein
MVVELVMEMGLVKELVMEMEMVMGVVMGLVMDLDWDQVYCRIRQVPESCTLVICCQTQGLLGTACKSFEIQHTDSKKHIQLLYQQKAQEFQSNCKSR